jgi:hypothetical protein
VLEVVQGQSAGDEQAANAAAEAIEAEQALLGALLMNYQIAAPRANRLIPGAFFREVHRHLFDAVGAVAQRGQAVDFVTVADEMHRTGIFDRCGGAEYLVALEGCCPTPYHAGSYARCILVAARERALREVGEAIAGGTVAPSELAERLAAIEARFDLRDGDIPCLFTDAADLVTAPPEPQRIMVGSPESALVLDGEGCILHGPPRAMKSWIGAGLAVAVASGKRFLGQFGVQQGPVAIVQEEGSGAAWAARLRMLLQAAGVAPDDIRGKFRSAHGTGLRLDQQTWVSRLVDELADFQPRLLILDPLTRLHALDENAASDMARVTGALDEIRRALGCAVILVHHSRKRREGDEGLHIAETLRGSSALWAWGSTISVTRSVGSDTVRVEAELKDASPAPPFELGFLFEGGSVQLTYDGSAGTEQQLEGRAAVARALEVAGEPLTASGIAKATGIPRGTAHRMVRALVAEGRAEVIGESAVRGGRAAYYGLL